MPPPNAPHEDGYNVARLDEHRRKFMVVTRARLTYDDLSVSAVQRIEWLGNDVHPSRRVRDGVLIEHGERSLFFNQGEALALALALELRRPCSVFREDGTESSVVRFSSVLSSAEALEMATVGSLQFFDPDYVARVLRGMAAIQA